MNFTIKYHTLRKNTRHIKKKYLVVELTKYLKALCEKFDVPAIKLKPVIIENNINATIGFQHRLHKFIGIKYDLFDYAQKEFLKYIVEHEVAHHIHYTKFRPSSKIQNFHNAEYLQILKLVNPKIPEIEFKYYEAYNNAFKIIDSHIKYTSGLFMPNSCLIQRSFDDEEYWFLGHKRSNLSENFSTVKSEETYGKDLLYSIELLNKELLKFIEK